MTSTGLPDSSGDPDALVAQIPYRPAEDLDPFEVLDFIDDAALCLPADRFAAVLGPASILIGDLPTGPAARRADLLKADMVEAVIRLPGGCVPYRPGYETAIWVLTQARASRWRGRVLLADVSDRRLTADVVRDLAEDVVTWRRDGYVPKAHHRVYGVQLDVSSLVASLGPLVAVRWPASPRELKTRADTKVTLVTQFGADLDRIGATATADRRHVTTEVLTAADRHPAAASVGALIRQRRLIMRKGTRITPGDLDRSGTSSRNQRRCRPPRCWKSRSSTGAKAQPHHPHARRRGQGRRVDRDALRLIGSWSDRKSRLFTEAHVGKAINRLEELGWAGK